jgi:hypothetical protein
MVEKLISLPDPYISKPIHKDTLSHVLNNSAFVANGLYLITNGVNQRYEFLELDNPYLSLSAYVIVDYAYIGEARNQASAIPGMSIFLKKKPRYLVFCELSAKGVYNNYIYKFKFRTNRKKSVYSKIEKTKTEIKSLVQDWISCI